MSGALFWNQWVGGRRTLGACFAEALDVTTSLLTDIVQGNIELLSQ
jgi:hypothetical protein